MCFAIHNKSFTQETEDGKTCDKKNPTWFEMVLIWFLSKARGYKTHTTYW